MEIRRYAKIDNGVIIFAPQHLGNIFNYNLDEQRMLADDYKPVVVEPLPDSYSGYTCAYVEEDVNGIPSIVAKWVYTDITLLDSIEQLKQSLVSSDFKVVKCYEYSLVGKELPYDIEQLHNERDKIRARIAELESHIYAPHLAGTDQPLALSQEINPSL